MPKGYLAAAAFADKYAKKASLFQRQLLASLPEGYLAQQHCWRVCPSAISLQQHLLTSMHKGYLAAAAFADEYAKKASSFQRQLLASLPEGYLAQQYCWQVCHKAILLQHRLLISSRVTGANCICGTTVRL